MQNSAMELGTERWFRARLRWAVMIESQGLDRWEEAEYLFLSRNHRAAFERALSIGLAGQTAILPDDDNQPVIDRRFAEVRSLQPVGRDEVIELSATSFSTQEKLPFAHMFHPAESCVAGWPFEVVSVSAARKQPQ